MNTKRTILLLLAALLSAGASLKSAVGCMDNSHYLRQNFDTKAYHYVQCDCECRSKAPGTNRCARCGHLQVPQEKEYVTQIDTDTQKESKFTSLMQNPDEKLKQLIERYRKLK